MNGTGSMRRPAGKRIALVLQGGGALGVYQAGIYQALDEQGFAPDWVGGTSIGAINGAIIAGNPADRRLARLREFWHTVSVPDFWDVARLPALGRQAYSAWSFMMAVLTGRPGFFAPRGPYALAALNGASPETLSYYDTSPLRQLLDRLVDFDILNAHAMRLSVGAVGVTTGKLRYFDNREQRLRPEHILASSALPPAFPAVQVDGELYWDGGIYSNTPLEVVLDDPPWVDTLCFMAALFNPAGRAPRSLPEVEARPKTSSTEPASSGTSRPTPGCTTCVGPSWPSTSGFLRKPGVTPKSANSPSWAATRRWKSCRLSTSPGTGSRPTRMRTSPAPPSKSAGGRAITTPPVPWSRLRGSGPLRPSPAWWYIGSHRMVKALRSPTARAGAARQGILTEWRGRKTNDRG